MKFTAEVYLIDFDKAGYLNQLHAEMTETTKEAARKWLQVVTVIIPVWSRASIATFTDLAAACGFSLNMGSLVAMKDRTALGKQAGHGGVKTLKTKKVYYFWYSTDLRYLAWNEFNTAVAGDGSGWFSTHRSGPGPYRFLAAGAAEFESFAATVKLPNPIKFIQPKRIK